jgi:hypothetical protein
MANYTTDEIVAVVEQLVRSSIRRPYDTLGVRRTDVTFNDIQESAASVFLLYPKSPFYLAFLSGQRLRELLTGEASARANLLDSLAILRKRSLPVRDVSSLVNAKVALFELESAVNQPNPPSDLTKVSAYVKFNSNVNRFLKAVGGNIVKDGEIVQTADQARKSLPGLVEVWKGAIVEIFRRVTLLAGALDDYNSIGLARLVSTGVVQRSRAMLDARATGLEKMTETERNEVLRETVLEVLGVQAVVTKFGAFPGLTASTSATGTLTVFADVSRPAIPASCLVPAQGLLVLIPGSTAGTSTNILDVWLDGVSPPATPSLELYLPTSLYPRLDGNRTGPFLFNAGVNDSIQFLVDGTTTVTATFPAGSQTYATVVTQLQTALSPEGFTAEGYFFPLMFDGQVTVSGNNLAPTYGAFPAGSVNVGDEVDLYFGINPPQTRTVTAVNIVLGAVVSIDVSGPPLLSSTTDRIRYGSPDRRVRVLPLNKVSATVAQRSIQVKQPTVVERQCGITLGFYGELTNTGRGWEVQAISDFINGNNALCTSSTQLSPVLTNQTVQTDPGDAFGLILASTAGVQVGMVVVVPTGINAGTYSIVSVPSLTKLKLRTAFPQYRAGFNVSVTLTGCSVGYAQYRLASKNTTLASTVEVVAPVEGGVYATATGVASSVYLTFPGVSKLATIGDKIEIYNTTAAAPDQVLNITQVFGDDVIRVDSALSAGTSYSLTSGTAPFARLITGHISNFDEFSAALRAQLSSSYANTSLYFKDLNRFINPLLVNLNPTDSDIASAETRVADMENVIDAITLALDNFSAEVIPQMDHLVKGLKEKGADRAVDILMECRFKDFFGLNQEQMSYAGTMQAAIRDVALNDLAVHKSNRLARSISPLRSSSTSPDYETDLSDLDPTPIIDPPDDVDESAV